MSPRRRPRPLPPDLDLTGRVALVTGGSRGIGRATCLRLAAAGARVVVNFRQREREARATVAAIRSGGGEAVAIGADVADVRQARALVAGAVERFGRLDVLVNNAGRWEPTPLLTAREEDWRRVLAVNLDGVFHVTQAAARAMRRRRRGAIVNIASTAGQRGEARYGAYAAAKGALISLTKSWCVELAPLGIRVNCVAPGWVDTAMTADALRGAGGHAIRAAIPIGRPGRAAEIAAAVHFLAADASSFVVGEVLNVNGGAVLVG